MIPRKQENLNLGVGKTAGQVSKQYYTELPNGKGVTFLQILLEFDGKNFYVVLSFLIPLGVLSKF